jgi:ribonuclease HII
MVRALAHLDGHDYVLLDGLAVKDFEAQIGPYRALVGGDASSGSVACASVVAKVARDRLMTSLAARWVGYGWERNVGYGTREHLAALAALGPTPHHRRSFAPLRNQVMQD